MPEEPADHFEQRVLPEPLDHQIQSGDPFRGPHGLRAGWAFLLFTVIFLLLSSVARTAAEFWIRRSPSGPQLELVLREGLQFAAVMIATSILAIGEGRTIFSYGLADIHSVRRFFAGVAAGFVSLTAMLLALRAGGDFFFGSPLLHGTELISSALLWAGAFLMVAAYEETLFRGYALAVLARGIGFPAAALILSLLFGGVHLLNGGENYTGVAAAGLFGLILCFALKRTGSLWWPIGFHASWDYSESFVYSTPDSGQLAPEHLMDSRFTGPAWVTGGSAGPEGSILILIVLALIGLWIHLAYPPRGETLHE